MGDPDRPPSLLVLRPMVRSGTNRPALRVPARDGVVGVRLSGARARHAARVLGTGLSLGWVSVGDTGRPEPKHSRPPPLAPQRVSGPADKRARRRRGVRALR